MNGWGDEVPGKDLAQGGGAQCVLANSALLHSINLLIGLNVPPQHSCLSGGDSISSPFTIVFTQVSSNIAGSYVKRRRNDQRDFSSRPRFICRFKASLHS